ncbi:MAG: hypothetical protein MUE51_05610 [Thermoleophilia bacterium]|nr:hypothetical protein [Thermoleophilia bacterium]
MADTRDTRPALRVIAGGGEGRPPVPRVVVERAVVAVVVSAGTVPRGLLTVMTVGWLEIRRPAEALPETPDVLRALAACMARGEVASRGTRLVPGPAVTDRVVG